MRQVQATDDFKITWPDPSMSESAWVTDRMHFPNAVAPLAQYMVGGFMERVMGSSTVFANGYQYSFGQHAPDPTPEVVAGGLNVWHNDYSPRIRAFCERVRNTDFDAMSNAELAAALTAVADEALECLNLTMVVLTTFQQPTFHMLEFLESEIESDVGLLSGALIQGAGNATAASGKGLQALTDLAGASPQLADALASGSFDGLDQLPGGPALLDELSRFLDEFGSRVETWGSMHLATWSEDHSKPLALIARYLADPDSAPDAAAQRSEEQQAAALAEVEEKLSAEKFDQFRSLFEATSHHVAVSEDRARWQLSSIGVVRLPALALGRKLVDAGLLNQPDDIFFLTWDEAQRASKEPGDWIQATADAGRSAFAHWEQLTSPPTSRASTPIRSAPSATSSACASHRSTTVSSKDTQAAAAASPDALA